MYAVTLTVTCLDSLLRNYEQLIEKVLHAGSKAYLLFVVACVCSLYGMQLYVFVCSSLEIGRAHV